MSEFVHQRVQDSEDSYLNTTFWDVQPLFLLVKNGNTASLEERLNIQFEHFPEGRITRDARKQLEYLAVSLVNTFMIAAIEGGVFPPDANAIADEALRHLAKIRDVSEIPDLVETAAIRLCMLVRKQKDQNTGNTYVEKAKHYMAAHLTQEIRNEDIAEDAGISLFHLSRLFKSMTGKTMQEYLRRERIDAAKQLLVTSTLTIPQIAALFRFCDQSHFTAVFRRMTGMTPGQYQKANRI